MKELALSGIKREELGGKNAKKIRANGFVPCVLYGGKESVNFYIKDKELRDLVYSPDVFKVNLSVDGQSYIAYMKDLQFHPVTDKIMHIDFLEIKMDKPLKAEIPVRLQGNSIGVLNGGKLHLKQRNLSVKGLVDKLPEYIDIDIAKLRIGQAIKVKDLKVKDIELLNQPTAVVVAVKTTRTIVEEEIIEEEEEGTETKAETTEGSGEEKGAEAKKEEQTEA